MVREVIDVNYGGNKVGAVSFNTETGLGEFEYYPEFIALNVELSPIKMPLDRKIYSFPELEFETFRGLPGLVADSLPDDFGNAVLNSWVASQGKDPESITPLQRLQYIGKRGMGALEFSPPTRLKNLNATQKVEIESLVKIAQDVLDERNVLTVGLSHNEEEDEGAMKLLLSVGTSAGGARPKAVLAFNEDFTEVRSGQVDVPETFTHYLMKFDGVSEHNKNQQTFGDPQGYGVMEYVYHKIAQQCGIDMMPCRLLQEGKRRHFITRRFDRAGNRKIHIQTLNGLAHVDYKKPGSFSYAELFGVARKLKLPASAAEQLFRRLVFNIVARNHDDHAKNFAFLLDKGKWSLAPAYDVVYSFKPGNKWIDKHWMSLNGKRDDFTREDFYSLESVSPLFSRSKIDKIIDETTEHVSQWEALARKEGLPRQFIAKVQENLRLDL